MTKQEFISLIHDKLVAAGMETTTADEKCEKISQNFNKLAKDDAAKYYTEANAEMVAAKIVGDSHAKGDKSDAKDKPTIVIPKQKGETHPKSGSDTKKTTQNSDILIVKEREKTRPQSGIKGRHKGRDDDGRHPRLLLWLLALLCAPSILLVIALIIGSTLAIAIAMAGMIIALVTVIAAVVCGGSVLSIAALIYGITQIISEPRYVGLHEIGLAMVFAGATIAVSIVLYNIAVRLIPFLYKLIGKGLVLCRKKIKVWAVAAWKGCENL